MSIRSLGFWDTLLQHSSFQGGNVSHNDNDFPSTFISFLDRNSVLLLSSRLSALREPEIFTGLFTKIKYIKKAPRVCPRLRRLTKVAPNRTNPRLKFSRSTVIYIDVVSTSLTYERGLWIWVVGTYNVLFSVQGDSVFSLENNNNTPLCTFKFCLKPTVESNQTMKM